MRVAATNPSAVARAELNELLETGLAQLKQGRSFAVGFDDIAELIGDELLISVHPKLLQLQLANSIKVEGKSCATTDFFVGQGDWLPWLADIEKSRVFREARQLQNHAYRVRPTPAYKHYVKLIETKVPFTLNHVAIDSVETLEDYFKNFRRMFRRAEEHGIVMRSSTEINETSGVGPTNSARPIWTEYAERNVGVAIGADGSLYRLGPGQHRTAVAKLLKLTSMPCEVRMIHLDWLLQLMKQHDMPADQALLQGLSEFRNKPVIQSQHLDT